MAQKTLQISEIRENKIALRNVNTESEDFRGLVDSIKQVGIMNPISVRERVIDGETTYELVDGLHRFTGAQEAGLTEIPVNIVDLKDTEVMEAQIITNVHKVETKPVEYSKQIQRIMAANPTMTINEMASRLCKTPGWLSERLGLLKLEDNVAQLVDDGKINLSNAYALAKLPPDEQVNFLDRAQTMIPQEFVPTAQARVKEIREARRKGQDADKAEFIPVPHLQKLALLKQELSSPSIIPSLVKDQKVKDPVDAAVLTLKWVLHMDPHSIDAAKQKDDARKAELEEAKKRRAVEKAEKKAKKAADEAAKAAEAAKVEAAKVEDK